MSRLGFEPSHARHVQQSTPNCILCQLTCHSDLLPAYAIVLSQAIGVLDTQGTAW